ncbi:MAG: FHA domain-containing protein [Phycisphaerales bacterium]|nr:FHA domain-containing protein [Phycisphaerales bacterium]
MGTIYIIKGRDNGAIYSLTDEPCIIGRSEKCSVKLDDDRVSGAHLRISRTPDATTFTAEDTKSTNGTWINGRALTVPSELANGDKIELGSTVIEFTTMTFDSVDAAKAAREGTAFTAPPTMMEDRNRSF